MNETWKPVVGLEGLYEVSDKGKVKSLSRIVKHSSGGEKRLRQRILKTDKAGRYAQCNLRKEGMTFTMKVHWLVMEAFVGPRPDGMETRHLDGDYQNPQLNNLIYGTASQNQMDRVMHGTSNRGERCAASVLKRQQV